MTYSGKVEIWVDGTKRHTIAFPDRFTPDPAELALDWAPPGKTIKIVDRAPKGRSSSWTYRAKTIGGQRAVERVKTSRDPAPRRNGDRAMATRRGGRIEKKSRFYSGELVLDVALVEGFHEDPRERSRQVRGCPHNSAYKVTIRRGKAGAPIATQWVCPPRSLSKAVDAPSELKDAARAALSFADDEGKDISDRAAFDDSGYYVGRTPGGAWPKESSRDPAPRRKLGFEWNTYAGGTGARKGTNSFDARGSFGEYHIDPPRAIRPHEGYSLKWANTKGLPAPHSGLWHELGTYRSPQAAKKAAQDHARSIATSSRDRSRFGELPSHPDYPKRSKGSTIRVERGPMQVAWHAKGRYAPVTIVWNGPGSKLYLLWHGQMVPIQHPKADANYSDFKRADSAARAFIRGELS